MSTTPERPEAGERELPINATIRERLKALPEDEACQLLRDRSGVPMSRQYLWQIRYGTGASERKMSLRLFARAVARLNLGDESCPIRASLKEAFPDEFAPLPKRRKLVRTERSPRAA